jgi:hypothetical protein
LADGQLRRGMDNPRLRAELDQPSTGVSNSEQTLRGGILDTLPDRRKLGCLPALATRLVKIGAHRMSKMSGDSARFNKIKKRRNVHRARMRVLREEIAARKMQSGSGMPKLKT